MAARRARVLVRMLTAASLLLASLVLLAAPPAMAAAPAAWPKVRFDGANTGFNSSETHLSAANVASLAQDWSVSLGYHHGSPVVAGGVAYLGCDPDAFCAVDTVTGAVRWRTVVGTQAPRAAAVVGNVVIVGASRPPVLYALDAGTGAVVWKTLVSNSPGADFAPYVVLADGLVIAAVSHHLFAWDTATGIQRWVLPLGVGSAPTVVNGVLYLESPGWSPVVYAIRAATGETIWRSKARQANAGTSPTVWNGLVIVDNTDPLLPGSLLGYAIGGCGAAVCAPVWSWQAPAPGGVSARAGNVLYRAISAESIGALDLASRQLLWTGETDGVPTPSPAGFGPPTVANGLVFAVSDGVVYAWAASGCGAPVCQPLWSAPGGNAAADVVVLDGRIYVADSYRLSAFTPRVNPPPVVAPPPVPERPPVPPVRTVPTTLQVQRDHLSIQRAIDASIDGDTIVVAPGVYHERLDFHGKAIEVRSAGGPEVTTVDGDGVSTVVMFQTNETRASTLRGLTIRNGYDTSSGGIGAEKASPTIVGNIVSGNLGSGIEVYLGAPLVEGNQIRDNRPILEGTGGSGGGLYLAALAGAEVRRNVIENNGTSGEGGGAYIRGPATVVDNVVRRNRSYSAGGGMYVGGDSRTLVAQNVIVGNSTQGTGGGIELGNGTESGPRVIANTIADNAAWRATGMHTRLAYGRAELVSNVIAGPVHVAVVACDHIFQNVVPHFSHNDVFGGAPADDLSCGDPAADGGSTADPRFVDAGAGDYRLGRGSPAIDAGAAQPTTGGTDIAGAPRVVDGDGDGVATIDAGAYEAQPPVPEPGAGYRPLEPARILDTRNGTGGFSAAVGPAGTIAVPVAGRGGVPATGASAVVLNVTVTQPTAETFLTVFPNGTPRPLASNLNVLAGQTVPNLVTAKLGADGKVAMYNHSGTVHVVADVVGWYGEVGAPGGSRLNPLAPARVLDTRTGTGGFGSPVGAASTISPLVTGVGGVPAAGVTAVVLNVTVTEPTAETFLTVFPSGTTRPLASNLNAIAGRTVPNLVIAKVGADGRVSVYNHSGRAHVIFDVVGWFGADGAPAGSRFHPLVPARVLDTRNGTGGLGGPVGPGATIFPTIAGQGGVPLGGVTAVVLNVTVTQPTAETYVTVFPSGTTPPLASNLNVLPGQTVPNLVVARVGPDGKVSVYNNTGTLHVVIDVVGWFAI